METESSKGATSPTPLPAAAAPASPPTPPIPALPPNPVTVEAEAPPTPPEKKRILIVDDEAPFARMVKLNLERTGAFEVRTENRAANAVVAAREFKPDLIILDVIMPNMDGGDVQGQIKRDRALRDTPIIFLTATVSKREAGEGGLNSGGELFLAKPVSVENLVSRINERLRKAAPPPDEKKP
jgi:DNA-binding response OmpR family regulator